MEDDTVRSSGNYLVHKLTSDVMARLICERTVLTIPAFKFTEFKSQVQQSVSEVLMQMISCSQNVANTCEMEQLPELLVEQVIELMKTKDLLPQNSDTKSKYDRDIVASYDGGYQMYDRSGSWLTQESAEQNLEDLSEFTAVSTIQSQVEFDPLECLKLVETQPFQENQDEIERIPDRTENTNYGSYLLTSDSTLPKLAADSLVDNFAVNSDVNNVEHEEIDTYRDRDTIEDSTVSQKNYVRQVDNVCNKSEERIQSLDIPTSAPDGFTELQSTAPYESFEISSTAPYEPTELPNTAPNTPQFTELQNTALNELPSTQIPHVGCIDLADDGTITAEVVATWGNLKPQENVFLNKDGYQLVDNCLLVRDETPGDDYDEAMNLVAASQGFALSKGYFEDSDDELFDSTQPFKPNEKDIETVFTRVDRGEAKKVEPAEPLTVTKHIIEYGTETRKSSVKPESKVTDDSISTDELKGSIGVFVEPSYYQWQVPHLVTPQLIFQPQPSLVLGLQPLAGLQTCTRSRRVGLSRRQKVQRLHSAVRR